MVRKVIISLSFAILFRFWILCSYVYRYLREDRLAVRLWMTHRGAPTERSFITDDPEDDIIAPLHTDDICVGTAYVPLAALLDPSALYVTSGKI